ncbi:MAG: NADH-quinone oxidoreductase subunit NuoK [Planctomycetota bacterium]|jgi:NADH-quinone oxidoreductase subunit K|nr:NADH-quinone oxidoreductase subunit NuoK [Planctomycetota bacterium]MDA1026136.1 NADH-quinone oxidoreductase subunit NuoK [Planctomycetota bacterium]
MNDVAVSLTQAGEASTMVPITTGTIQIVLLVSAVMFAIGMVGFLIRRNMILMFLCTELMFQASAIAMIAFGRMHLNPEGQVFVIFILTVAAAEAALALGLVVLLYRRKPTLDAEAWSELKEC